VDSNCDPDYVDHVIPGNDDSMRAIQLYCSRMAGACVEGAALFNERVQAEVAEEEKARAAGARTEKPATGRVVVEIKQQPRRGRGAHTSAGRRGEEKEDAKPDTTPAVASETPPAGK